MGPTADEIAWLSSINITHGLFCCCENPVRHLLRILDQFQPEQQCAITGGGDRGDGPTDAECADVAVTFDLGIGKAAAGDDAQG